MRNETPDKVAIIDQERAKQSNSVSVGLLGPPPFGQFRTDLLAKDARNGAPGIEQKTKICGGKFATGRERS